MNEIQGRSEDEENERERDLGWSLRRRIDETFQQWICVLLLL